jgi:hypothetical protein
MDSDAVTTNNQGSDAAMTVATQVMLKVQTLPEDQQRQVLEFIEQLPPRSPQPRPPLYGLFKGFDTTEEEIAEARREMWGNCPREDF